MSLDKLAVIFIIIILPISVVLNVYTDYQAKTLNLQISYDEKLNKATSDAIKAYQLNAFNESTSDLSESKMRDIKAAANSFFNSLATSFNMAGYGKETLQQYVPALVFTMYDGYYIYSRYTNTLSEEDYTEGDESLGIEPSRYKDGDDLYGVKPFISYSCRYIDCPEQGDDFVITYTLDNYISIQGQIKGEWINDAGYVIDINKIEYDSNSSSLTYRGQEIKPEEIMKEKVGQEEYPYQKIKGVKYYYDKNHKNDAGNLEPQWFSLMNGDKLYTTVSYTLNNDYSAYNYYKDAYNFTNRLKNKYKIGGLTPSKAYTIVETIKEDGEVEYELQNITDELNQSETTKIFGENFAEGIEEPSSNFNEHRLAIIRYTIEKDLSIAIKNYNKYSPNVDADFQMPKLEETEWDKIMNNITLISFLQGMPIGAKVYNGCCVVANNKNDEVVAEEAIYIANNTPASNGDKYFYSPLYSEFDKDEKKLIGVLNVDLERRSIEGGDATVEEDYYYPKEYYADYDSIVSPTKNVNLYADQADPAFASSTTQYAYNGNIYKYMENNAESNVATAYFTALGRERYSTYKISDPYKIPRDVKYFEGNSHKYYIFKKSDITYWNNNILTETTLTWNGAEAYCESIGGHLATINSEREQQFLKEYIGSSAETASGKKFWIGGINNKWITGEVNNDLSYSGVDSNYFSWYNSSNPNAKSDNTYFICEWEK